MDDWKETKLWKLLEAKPPAEIGSVRTMLEQCMPQIQNILASGGTSPNDFTLHDADHSFRVAQRMVDITPLDVRDKLSTYELALLLLSAYLHDIGMTPQRQKVRQHYTYLLTGELNGLTTPEMDEFQTWLDDEGSGIVPPLSSGPATEKYLRSAEELITYYCRHKHNDWSGEWIEQHRDWFKLGTYASFTDDLIRLCKSHHHGYKELIKDEFNPRNVGATVHLRYLAVLLRLADILEFDPERTPEVVLRHRDIAPSSLIYWHKDHEVRVTQDGNRLVAYARPGEARMHRAIETMLDDIEKELRLCRTLADETHFETSPGIQERLPHHWDLSGTLHREDVKPRNDQYEYINGAFRPDTQKILEMLSGVELYGSPFVAVRELLQNAFDAVREQIAHQRLELTDPHDTDAVNALQTLCRVTLKLEQSGDDFWLVCTDNGVGMTKDIINRYLLVSGSARRHDILDLERRCKAKGFTLGRTGQFGVGVLSYFMLADKLEIRTRRSQDAGGDEQTGWHFATEGIGSFGELRRDVKTVRGTQICLHLKREVIGNDPAAWYAELCTYLTETLRYLPCRFLLESNMPDCAPFLQPIAWVDVREQLSTLVVNFKVRSDANATIPLDQLHSDERRKFVDQEQEFSSIREAARQCLNFYVESGDLPNGIGNYRLHLPYFDLPGGAALGFLRIREENGSLCFVNPEMGHGFIWGGKVQASWKGMRVESLLDKDTPMSAQAHNEYEYDPFADPTPIQRLHMRSVLIEVDLCSAEAGRLAVNRNSLIITDKAQHAMDWLKIRVRETSQNFMQTIRNSVYNSLNRNLSDANMRPLQPAHWLQYDIRDGREIACWSAVKYPTSNAVLSWNPTARRYLLVTNGQGLNSASPIITIGGERYNSLSTCFVKQCPDKILIQEPAYPLDGYMDHEICLPVWLTDPYQDVVEDDFTASQFAPQWSNVYCVYGVDMRNILFRNQDHPLTRLWSKEAELWCDASFGQSLDPLSYTTELLHTPNKAAAWLRKCIRPAASSLCRGLIERHRDFLVQVWNLLFTSPQTLQGWAPLCIVSFPQLIVITPDEWKIVHIHDQIEWRKYLPEVDAEWRVEVKSMDENTFNVQDDVL